MGRKMKKKWIVGTRGSKLALTQTELVISKLKAIYPDMDFGINIIKTTGDSVWNTPLYLIGEKGLFIKEIEEALARGDADLAVHSMKDLPTDLLRGLAVSAILEREDPRDTFISLKYSRLADTPQGARIGTSSMRRKAQLLAFRKDLEIVPLRGNVDTRLKKLNEDSLDGIILAHAGVRRMGFADRVTEVIPFDVMISPSGQGAIGIETRAGDEAVELVRPLNDEATAFEVALERQFQTGVGGGCSVPLGVNASLKDGRVTLHAVFGAEDGTIIFREHAEGAEEEGEALVQGLLKGLKKAQGSQV
jgi:hydroxymethylbilane synthase